MFLFLPESTHTLIYNLFQIMAQHNYTPKAWCRSATCLLYKPNKKDPHNIAYYRSIALMNGILKLWTSILTNIGSPRAEAQGILSDTTDGFRRHRKIYDSLYTHIMMYEDVKMSKKHIHGLLRLQRRLRRHGPQNTLSNYARPMISGMLHQHMRTTLKIIRHLLHDTTLKYSQHTHS